MHHNVVMNMNLFPKRLSFLRPGLRTILAFGLPFVLYLLTLAPTVYNLDSAELSAAAATGGLVRATGYPLYLTIGYFWSKLPLGDVGYRMNLFSAFAGALTILLADRLLQRWQVSAWAALGSLGLLATGIYFWGMSLIAEVYTLHTCLMMALILALVSWSESPSPASMAVLGLVMGMGLSHHAAAVLLIPGSLWYIGCTAPRKAVAPRSLLAGVGGLALGLSFYLYLPLRYAAQPAFNYVGAYDANLVFHPVNLQTIDGLWWLVSGRVFAGQMLAYTGADLWRETLRFLVELSRAFFLVGLVPGLLGAIVLARQNWRAASMLALMFICTAAFYINYRVVDKTTMFLPVYLIWAIWLAVGFQALITWVSGANEPLRAVNNVKVLRVLLVGCVLLAVAWNWRLV